MQKPCDRPVQRLFDCSIKEALFAAEMAIDRGRCRTRLACDITGTCTPVAVDRKKGGEPRTR